ncbi:MAG: hypothetical protein Q8P81_02275 [Nanoarchaeota archaeon]|nr:hypothetical protein [Nanoarchaeota archaeon]
MGFLDNSGDVILDSVLTDTGRYRLAKGDGGFKISKFSLGDDEISYNLYNYNHSSGSAYYDLAILQTPILEAFTNNTSTMKSHLISIPRNNLLYLPVIKINEVASNSSRMHTQGAFYVACDNRTEAAFLASTTANATQGLLLGETLGGNFIRLDQGLDTDEISFSFTIDADLVETQYIIEIDNRFGKIAAVKSGKIADKSFLDDDQVASYYLSFGTNPEFVTETSRTDRNIGHAIAGPQGTNIQFEILASLDLNTSTYLFDQLGTTGVAGTDAAFSIGAGYTVNYIDTFVRVTGATTGFRVDVPIRFVKIS